MTKWFKVCIHFHCTRVILYKHLAPSIQMWHVVFGEGKYEGIANYCTAENTVGV